MSYDHNIYVGWYAEFNKSTNKKEVGTKNAKFCPTNKKHSAKDKFCSQCGGEIQTREEIVYNYYASPHNLQYIETQDELTIDTLGKLTIEDLKCLKGTYVVFPEFTGTDKSILMAPGFNSVRDITRSDGFVSELKMKDKPTEEWIEKMKFIFDVDKMEIKFGIVMEVV